MEHSHHNQAPTIRPKNFLRLLGEAAATSKYFAGVREDMNRKHGEQSIAERLGGDTIVVRVGMPRPDAEETKKAVEVIKGIKSTRES